MRSGQEEMGLWLVQVLGGWPMACKRYSCQGIVPVTVTSGERVRDDEAVTVPVG